jgi:hypothetical protein
VLCVVVGVIVVVDDDNRNGTTLDTQKNDKFAKL